MANTAQYVDTVFYRMTKGASQPESKLWRAAIQSTLDNALQRLGDIVAADDGLAPLLFNTFNVTLGAGGSAGQDPINTFSPALLLSEAARQRWRVTMTGVRFSLQYRPTFHDLELPSIVPDPDLMRYTVFNKCIVVRDFLGAIPAQTALQIYGNTTPLITDTAIDTQLFDNLVDLGIAILVETGQAGEVMRSAMSPHTVAYPEAQLPQGQ